jgi:hypothetical protein
MNECRYLERGEGEVYCVYWDMALRGDEDIRCYPGGWECYEEPGGCIFEGRWMTLTEYAEYLESKSEWEIPEGYEIQEFRLDSEGLFNLSRSERHHRMDWMTGEFHYLKMRPGYPTEVKMVALGRLQYVTEATPSYFDQSQGSQWVASIWIADGPCRVDLAVVRKGEKLNFIEGYCFHEDFCPKVEEFKRSILESSAFALLREDLIHELSQRRVADLDRGGPQPFPQTVPPEDEDRDLWY